ncbi:MAG: hypothetical protein F6K62_25370 [Sphaerospermopsis sp. SIO1G2]|nr:hypothetical protein [Sphaerospermopsis sp. SIO1G2]
MPTLDPESIPTLALPTLEPLGEATPDLLPTLETATGGAENPVPTGSNDYLETFDSAGDWGIGILEDDAGNIEVNAEIEGGVLTFETFVENGFYWSTAGQNFGSGVYELDVTAVSGSENNGIGMIFFANNETDDFYLFEISSDGFVWLGYCQSGCQDISYLVGDGWFPSDAIKQGMGATNNMRVDVNDGSMTFYVNDTIVGEAFDTNLSSGDIGVAIESFDGGAMALEFDNFKYTAQP